MELPLLLSLWGKGCTWTKLLAYGTPLAGLHPALVTAGLCQLVAPQGEPGEVNP